MPDLFSVPIFFILFRETLEVSIVVSVLLSFIRQVFHDDVLLQRRLSKRIWLGTILGVLTSLAVGGAFITIWYTVAANVWSQSEDLWEGSFALLASVLVTLMGLAMLKTNMMQEKLRVKLSRAMEEDFEGSAGGKGKKIFSRFGKKYALMIVPFITLLREGLEAMVFLGGVAVGESPTSIPLAAFCGILLGVIIGFLLYRGSDLMRLHWFFVGSTCLLFLIAGGLLARSIESFESHAWQVYIGAAGQSDETGATTYNVATNVWFMSCCNPKHASNGGWAIFQAVLGWTNKASIGTITGYCLYWLMIMVVLVYLKRKNQLAALKDNDSDDGELEKIDEELKVEEKKAVLEEEQPEAEK